MILAPFFRLEKERALLKGLCDLTVDLLIVTSQWWNVDRQGVSSGRGLRNETHWFQNLNYEATNSLPVSLMSSLLLTEHMFRFWWIHTHVSTSPKPDPPPQAPPSVSLLLFVPQPAALSCMIWMSDSPANTFPQCVRCDSGRIGGWLMNSCLLSSSNCFHQLTGGCERLTAHGGLASAGLCAFRLSVVSETEDLIWTRETRPHTRRNALFSSVVQRSYALPADHIYILHKSMQAL